MPSKAPREIHGEVSYLDLAGPDELPEGIRVRIALDVFVQLVDECAPTLGPRSARSRLRLANIRVGPDGKSRVTGKGDTSGAQLLLWEIIAGRVAPPPPLPRVHDVVDEVHPDVDDVVTDAAISRRHASIEEVLESFEDACRALLATHEEIAACRAAIGSRVVAPPVVEAHEDRAIQPIEVVAEDNDEWDIALAGLGIPGVSEPPSAAPPSAPLEPVAATASLAVTDEATVDHTSPASVPVSVPEPADMPPGSATSSPRDSHTRVSATEPEDELDATEVHSVLVIGAAADDRTLCSAIEEAGHLVICTELELAQDVVSTDKPSCVVLDVWHQGASKGAGPPSAEGRVSWDAGDAGYRFVHWMRMHDSHAAAIPLLLIAPGAQEATPLSGFLVGADVCMMRPYRVAEVVGQVAALVRMSMRLRAARERLRSRPVQKAFEGNLAHVSIATLLSVLEMEGRTGIVEVLTHHHRVELQFERGNAVRGRIQGFPVSALGALESMLGCQRGRFSFSPMPEREGVPRGIGIGELLLEALRRRDEQAHDDADLHGSARGATS